MGWLRRFGSNPWVTRWCHVPQPSRATPSWQKENLFALLVFHLHPLCTEWVLPLRREAQSRHVSCESHQENRQTPNHKNQVP